MNGFILRYRPKAPTTMVGLLTHRTSQDGYFVLLVQPKTYFVLLVQPKTRWISSLELSSAVGSAADKNMYALCPPGYTSPFHQ